MRAICFVALVMIGVLLIGAIAREPGATAPICMDAETREHARRIMLDGIDDALKRQFRKVYQSWMQDPHEQPHRALKGMQQGMAAYVSSRKAAQAWSPPEC